MIDEKFPNDPKVEELVSEPSQEVLAIISLLMRQNDILMGILQNLDHLAGKNYADEVYDLHSEGGTLNPKLFIPVFEVEEDKSKDAGNE